MNPASRPKLEHRSAWHAAYPVNTVDPSPVRAHGPAAVERALASVARHLVPGRRGVHGLERLTGGASHETWAFTVGDVPLVLRRRPPGGQARFAGCVAPSTEARLLDIAARAGVPVPQVSLVLLPEHGLGEGFIMERVAGETLGNRIVCEQRYAVARQALAYQCGTALARIHNIATESLPVLRMAPAQAQLAHLMDVHHSCRVDRPVFESAFKWLLRHAPPMPVSPALVHGDFRNGNILVREAGLRAVIDWELAHVGDPMEDLGWICVKAWRFGRSDLPVGGFGSREQLLSGYEAAGGRADTARLHYWEVMGTLKWAIVCDGKGHARQLRAEPGRETVDIGEMALEAEADLLALLAPR
jgi:aminoglycoside phosphotransferase (APT) family kinase protein